MERELRYQVYLLENASGRRYIGLSENVLGRLEAHNAGKSRWTARHRPWELRWTSVKLALSEARKLENQLKRKNGGDGLWSLLERWSGS